MKDKGSNTYEQWEYVTRDEVIWFYQIVLVMKNSGLERTSSCEFNGVRGDYIELKVENEMPVF